MTSAYVIAYYRKEGNYLRVNSFAFSNLITNYEKLVVKTWGMAGVWLLAGIMNTIDDAGATKNETLFATALSVIEKSPKSGSPIMLKDEAYMQYYKKTGETDKYFTHAINYGKNYLMKKNIDSLALQDKKKLEEFENKVKSGPFAKFDTATIKMLRSVASDSEVKRISNGLNQIAWEAFEQTTDKNHLQGALILSKRSLEITPNNAELLDTKANLLYKLELKQEAIATEKEALRYADVKDIKGYKGMEETLLKMTAGEKTWK
jgi:tetratricopeptide (TPR) repeat protein